MKLLGEKENLWALSLGKLFFNLEWKAPSINEKTDKVGLIKIKSFYLQSRNRLTDVENRLAKEEVGRESVGLGAWD